MSPYFLSRSSVPSEAAERAAGLARARQELRAQDAEARAPRAVAPPGITPGDSRGRAGDAKQVTQRTRSADSRRARAPGTARAGTDTPARVSRGHQRAARSRRGRAQQEGRTSEPPPPDGAGAGRCDGTTSQPGDRTLKRSRKKSFVRIHALARRDDRRDDAVHYGRFPHLRAMSTHRRVGGVGAVEAFRWAAEVVEGARTLPAGRGGGPAAAAWRAARPPLP